MTGNSMKIGKETPVCVPVEEPGGRVPDLRLGTIQPGWDQGGLGLACDLSHPPSLLAGNEPKP